MPQLGTATTEVFRSNFPAGSFEVSGVSVGEEPVIVK